MASYTTLTDPPDSSSSPKAQRPLAEDIVASTKTIHARVNKLTMARLPLALPPLAADPGVYISGMLHYAPIYTTFETLWRDILLNGPPAGSAEDGSGARNSVEDAILLLFSGEQERPPLPVATCQQRIYSILKSLHFPGLTRATRLEADIRALTGWSHDNFASQLKTISARGQLADFINHIRSVVREKPHVLVAYSYVMYMALFAGGRFIRASFEGAGDEFWAAAALTVPPSSSFSRLAQEEKENGQDEDEEDEAGSSPVPLRFWRFEDLKQEYKQRLLALDSEFTAQERQDIVQESIYIFESVGSIISQIDSVWHETLPSSLSLANLHNSKNPLRSRLRDSVLLTRERSARNPSKNSSSPSGSETSVDTIRRPKSIRFNKSLPIPPRGLKKGAGNHGGGGGGGLKKRLGGVSVGNWLLVVAAIGLVLVGIMFTNRTSLGALFVGL